MLKSKIPLDTRGRLFHIIHFMLIHEGESWSLGKDLVSMKERTVEDAEKLKDLFPMVVAKSTMIEARVNMDIIARVVIDQVRSDDESDQLGLNKLTILESCYGIVERCIQFFGRRGRGEIQMEFIETDHFIMFTRFICGHCPDGH